MSTAYSAALTAAARARRLEALQRELACCLDTSKYVPLHPNDISCRKKVIAEIRAEIEALQFGPDDR